MAGESSGAFRTRIELLDETSSVLSSIKAHAKALGIEFDSVNRKAAEIHHPTMWAEMRENATHTGESFSKLGEHVSGVGERLAELVPAFSAVGAAAGMAAMLETTEKVADAYGELVHSAAELGMSAQQLHEWNTVAKLSDTNADAMAKSMDHLNRVMFDAGGGKNKDAAKLFEHLHLDPHKFKNSADALAPLADAFVHLNDKARASAASVLFGGRAGREMIPLLLRQGSGIRELQVEARKLQYDFSNSGEGLERYNESMKRLGVATDGFKDAIGADLAPALAPIVDQMTEWVAANRDWIASDISGEVRQVAQWAERVPWHAIGDEIGVWANRADWLAERLGGAKTAIDVLAGVMVLKGASFLVRDAVAATRLSLEIGKATFRMGELALSWGRVGTAAAAAEQKEIAALEAGKGAQLGGANALGPGMGAGKLGLKGLAMGGLLGMAVMDAQQGFSVSQEDIKRMPSLGRGMTPAQIAALPKGDVNPINKWADDNLPDLSLGHLFGGLFGGAKQTDVGSASFGEPVRQVQQLSRIPSLRVDSMDDSLSIPRGLDMAPVTSIGPAPSSRAMRHAEASPPGKVEVTVRFVNEPAGTATSATATGNAVVTVRHANTAFHDHYGP